MDSIQKRCSQCKQFLPVACFSPNSRTSDGLQSHCKQCASAYYEQTKRREKIAPPDFMTCIACGQTKPGTLEFFGKNNKSPHGLYTKCKECMNAYNRKGRRDHPERQVHHRELVRRWRALNPERNAFLRKRLRQQEHTQAQEKAYAQRNANTIRLYQREWHRGHRMTEHWKSYLKSYHQRDDVRARQRIYEHNKRVRFYSAPGQYTPQDIQRKLHVQKHRCYYCSQKFERRAGQYVYQIDHVVPLVRGGTNFPDNLVLACPFCNQSKGAKPLHEWTEGGRLF